MESRKMLVRKNISLRKEHLEMLKPFIKEHEGNISAAIRDVIVLAHTIKEKYGDLEALIEGKKPFYERYIEKGEGAIVPWPFLEWMLERCKGQVPPARVMREAINVEGATPMMWEEIINKIGKNFGYPVSVKVDFNPEKGIISTEIRGHSPLFNEQIAIVGSLFFANLSEPFSVKEADDASSSMRVVYERAEDREEACKSVIEKFGYNQEFFGEISLNMDFWKRIVKAFEMLNYAVVLMTREMFERMIKGEEYLGGIEFIGLKAGKYIKDISLEEMLPILKNLLENGGYVSRMNYNEEKILVYHHFGDREARKRVEKWILTLLESTGKKFDVETSYMTSVYRMR
ncbi:MAG: hypothetical protein ACXQT5_08470 [Candidatus Syntropharchaeia archaeon]